MARVEIPYHPELSRSRGKIEKADPQKVNAAKTIFDRLNNQLITNYQRHKTSDVTLPYTHVSTADLALPSGLFLPQNETSSRHNTSSSENILGLLGDKNRLTIVALPGYALPPHGTPIDNERVARIRDIVGYAALEAHQTQKYPEIEIYATGLEISRGGQVSRAWPSKIREGGFAKHGETFADFLSEKVLPESQAEKDNTTLVLLGESMGCFIARETDRALGETGIETYLYFKNPPGRPPEADHSPFLEKTQVVLGYGGETGVRKIAKLFAKKGTWQGIRDEQFFRQLSTYLTEEKDIYPDSRLQQILKRRSALIDGRNILKEIPFTFDEDKPTIVDRGWMDPTSFTIGGMRKWFGGEIQSIKGKTLQILDPHAHTPQYDVMGWAKFLGNN